MEQLLWLMPVGLLVGAFGTLIGTGGGFVLTPILLLAYPSESPEIITRIVLAVVFCDTFPGSVVYARMRQIDYKAGVLVALASLPGVVVGALATLYLPRQAFDLAFGLLMFLAAFVLVRQAFPSKESRLTSLPCLRRLMEEDGTLCFTFTLVALLGLLIHCATGPLHHGVRRTIVLVIGMLWGAHLSTRFSHTLHRMYIRRTVAVMLGGVGLWLLIEACV